MRRLPFWMLLLFFGLILSGCPGAAVDPVLKGNADLLSLTVSSGALSPAFDPDVTGYTVQVPSSVSILTVTGTAADGDAVVGGQSGEPVNLSSETTIITISVTAQNGTIKQYMVFVARFDAKYSIFFDVNGGDPGTALPPRTGLDDGEVIIVPGGGNLNRAGFRFAYWSATRDGSGDEIYEPFDFLTIAGENVTLYAQWSTDGLAYTLIKGDTEYAVSGGTATAASTISFPRIMNGKKVTAILDNGFAGFTSITSLTVPGAITDIGSHAFANCSGLAGCVLSPGVKTVGNGAFSQCAALKTVSIPGSVSSIGDVFDGCSDLTNVSIGDGVASIGPNAFSDLAKVKGMSIPGSVSAIGMYAFRNCVSLASLELAPGVGAIDGCAFQGCSGLTSLTIPGSVTFGPDSIGCQFSGCTGLATLVLEEGLTQIPVGAFVGCDNLTSVRIPASIEFIGVAAFRECSSLAAITVDPANQDYSSISGVLYDKAVNYLCCYPSGKASVCEIPASVVGILEDAFYSCPGLVEVRANNATFVPSPQGTLFEDCPNLTRILVPASAVDLYKAGWSAYAGIISAQ